MDFLEVGGRGWKFWNLVVQYVHHEDYYHELAVVVDYTQTWEDLLCFKSDQNMGSISADCTYLQLQ